MKKQEERLIAEDDAERLQGGQLSGHGKELSPTAEAVGMCKSSVSRETITVAEKELEAPTARRFEDVDLSIICVDRMVLGARLGAQSRFGGKSPITACR